MKLDASLALKEEYNDNIFITPSNKLDDFITTVSPALAFSDIAERSGIMLFGRLDGIYYAENDELNDIDQFFNTRIEHRLDPRLNLSGEFEYIKDSRPDRDIETTGLVLDRFLRYRRDISLAGKYSVSENTAASLAYAYVNQDFENPTSADYDSHNAGLTVTHRLAKYLPSTSTRMNIDYNRYDYPDIKVTNYLGTIGASHEITERLGLLIDLGGRYTKQRREDQPVVPTSDLSEHESGFTGQLRLSYKDEFTRQNLTFSHDIQAASGRNAVTERTALKFDISHRFTYNFKGSFKIGYYLNQADQGTFATEDIDEKTLRLQSALHYEIRDDVVLDASYIYTRSKDEVANESAKRNLIFLQFVIFYPFFE